MSVISSVKDLIQYIDDVAETSYKDVLAKIESRFHFYNPQIDFDLRTVKLKWMNDIEFAVIFSEFLETDNFHLLVRRIVELLHTKNSLFLEYCLKNIARDMVNICLLVESHIPYMDSSNNDTLSGALYVIRMDIGNEIVATSSRTQIRKLKELMQLCTNLDKQLNFKNFGRTIMSGMIHDYRIHKDLNRLVSLYNIINSHYPVKNRGPVLSWIINYSLPKDLKHMYVGLSLALTLETRYIDFLFADFDENCKMISRLVLSLYDICQTSYKMIKTSEHGTVENEHKYSVMMIIDFYKTIVSRIQSKNPESQQLFLDTLIQTLINSSTIILLQRCSIIPELFKQLEIGSELCSDLFVNIIQGICGESGKEKKQSDQMMDHFRTLLKTYYDPDETYNVICKTTLGIGLEIILSYEPIPYILIPYLAVYWSTLNMSSKIKFCDCDESVFEKRIDYLVDHGSGDMILFDILDIMKRPANTKNNDNYKVKKILQCVKKMYDAGSHRYKSHASNIIVNIFKMSALMSPCDKIVEERNKQLIQITVSKLIHEIFPEIIGVHVQRMYAELRKKSSLTNNPKTFAWLYGIKEIKDWIVKEVLTETPKNIDESKKVSSSKNAQIVENNDKCFACMCYPTHKFASGCGHGICASCFDTWYLVSKKPHECGTCATKIAIKF